MCQGLVLPSPSSMHCMGGATVPSPSSRTLPCSMCQLRCIARLMQAPLHVSATSHCTSHAGSHTPCSSQTCAPSRPLNATRRGIAGRYEVYTFLRHIEHVSWLRAFLCVSSFLAQASDVSQAAIGASAGVNYCTGYAIYCLFRPIFACSAKLRTEQAHPHVLFHRRSATGSDLGPLVQQLASENA